jgi:hypothetical protein
MEIADIFNEDDSTADRELKAVIELWAKKRMAEGATMDDLHREMNATCDVAEPAGTGGHEIGKGLTARG